MTNPPRKRGEPLAPTKADLERMFDKVGQQIQGSEERTGDKLSRVEAKGDARQEMNVKSQAEAAAKTDSLAEGQRVLGARLDEVVSTNLRGYRTLEDQQREARLIAEKQAAEIAELRQNAVPAAAEIAERTADHINQAGQRRSNRQTGLQLAGIVVSAGAWLWIGLKWATENFPVIKPILHIVSLGLVKATAAPHE